MNILKFHYNKQFDNQKTRENTQSDMNTIFIVLESCFFMLSLVLAFLWMEHPQATYEPTIVLLGVLITVLETFRQKLQREQASPEIEELKTALQKAINQLEDVKVNSDQNTPKLESEDINSSDYEHNRTHSLVKLRSEVESRIIEYLTSRGVVLEQSNIIDACNELPFPDIFKTFIKKFLESTEDLTQETSSMSEWADSAGKKVLGLLDSLITETPENQTPRG